MEQTMTQNTSRWMPVSPDLYAVLSKDRLTLMVGWRRRADGKPVTCSYAVVTKPVDPHDWRTMLKRALTMGTVGRDRSARAAAIAMVKTHGGTVLSYEDREAHLKVN